MCSFVIFKGANILDVIQIVSVIREGERAPWVFYKATKTFADNPKKNLEIKIMNQL